MTSDGLLFLWGALAVTGEETASAHITFPYQYDTAPSIVVTPVSIIPGACGVDSITVDGADVYVPAGVTQVCWLAIGKATIT